MSCRNSSVTQLIFWIDSHWAIDIASFAYMSQDTYCNHDQYFDTELNDFAFKIKLFDFLQILP